MIDSKIVDVIDSDMGGKKVEPPCNLLDTQVDSDSNNEFLEGLADGE